MVLGEIWDWITDAFWYILSFEWLSDLWELISGLFEDLGELSYGGLAFGVIMIVFVYVLRVQMLYPFLVHMGPVEAMIWGGATYASCGVVGYLIGKKLFDD